MVQYGESLVAFVELSSSHWVKQMNWEATLSLLRAVWGSMTDVQGGTSVFLSNSCQGMATTFLLLLLFPFSDLWKGKIRPLGS